MGIAVVAAFDPLTLTLGATSHGLAISALGALALVKEGLLLASLSRGRRSANEIETFKGEGALFDAIAAVDLADCGKLMVCHITAKLFKSFNGKVDPLHAQAQ